jgi:hypothetical protein
LGNRKNLKKNSIHICSSIVPRHVFCYTQPVSGKTILERVVILQEKEGNGMKKRMILSVLALVLMAFSISGCSWLDGRYTEEESKAAPEAPAE